MYFYSRWGHVCVPLDKSQSMASLEFTVKDSNSLAVITTKEHVDKVNLIIFSLLPNRKIF